MRVQETGVAANVDGNESTLTSQNATCGFVCRKPRFLLILPRLREGVEQMAASKRTAGPRLGTPSSAWGLESCYLRSGSQKAMHGV